MNIPGLIKDLKLTPMELYEKFKRFEDWKGCGMEPINAAAVTFETHNAMILFFLLLGLDTIEHNIDHIQDKEEAGDE